MRPRGAWVCQRIVDGQYFNGFRKRSWSKHVSSAIAFDSKEEAQAEMAGQGWQGVRYLLLPKVRRSPTEFAKDRPS